MKDFKFATQGIKEKEHNDFSRSLILDDILGDITKNNIDAIAIQETWLGEEEYEQTEKRFWMFLCEWGQNKHHGTGIIIKESLKATFKRVSSRVCAASFRINNNQHHLFISGYAPHEKLSNDYPEQRETFYNDLQKALSYKVSKSLVIIALDANAQTSYNTDNYTNVLGRFGKGNATNNNGTRLLEFEAENDFFSN